MSTAVTDLFALHAQNSPDKPAVIEGDDVFSFAQVNTEVNRLVDGLKQLGFNAGDRMVWCGPNSREVLVTIHAGRKLGLVSVPLSYRFNAEEMQYIESRKLNREEACMVYDMPPPVIHILDHATFSNITERVSTIRGWRRNVSSIANSVRVRCSARSPDKGRP